MPRIYYCSYKYCAAVHPMCSTAKSITLLDKVWPLTMRIYAGIKANISLGTTAFSCFTLHFAATTTTTTCIFLRKQSTFWFENSRFSMFCQKTKLPAVSVLPVGLQDFSEARNQLIRFYHLLRACVPIYSPLGCNQISFKPTAEPWRIITCWFR